MQKKVAIIHTSFVGVPDLKERFSRLIPEVKIMNIVDDSLLSEVMENGAITSGICKRMTCYFQMAEAAGASLVFNQCSSVGEAAEIAAKTIDIPMVRIDRPMAAKAVETGTNIAVVATVASTVSPSCRLIQEEADKQGKKVVIEKILVDGALKILMQTGDKAKHNALLLHEIEKLNGQCDVIVLAQGSMVVLLPELRHITTPVLSSPELGVLRVREVLNL